MKQKTFTWLIIALSDVTSQSQPDFNTSFDSHMILAQWLGRILNERNVSFISVPQGGFFLFVPINHGGSYENWCTDFIILLYLHAVRFSME